MKKKSIISAILASCLAVSALGAITVSADPYDTNGYDAYSMSSYIGGQKFYKGYGVADGRRAAVLSGFLKDKYGSAAYYAYGNAYQKVTNNISAAQCLRKGEGQFTFYLYKGQGYIISIGCSARY